MGSLQAVRPGLVEEEPVSLDNLLFWLSAKGGGSWSQFRAAVEELHVQRETNELDDQDPDGDRLVSSDSDLPVYQEVRFALQRLGHVEFRAGETAHDWRVVPPAVAFLPGTSACGLLCGARSSALLEHLQQALDIEMLVSQAEGMPQRILLRSSSRDTITARARSLGFHVQEAAPIALLSAVPEVRDDAIMNRALMPDTPGWSVHSFSTSRLQWTSVSQDVAKKARTGLFRFVLKHQRFYYLKWRGHSYKVPVQIGKYAIMGRRHGLLAYEAARSAFSVPMICRPPLLIERALVLCSGYLPKFQASSGRLEYGDVPHDVAELAAQILHQEIR